MTEQKELTLNDLAETINGLAVVVQKNQASNEKQFEDITEILQAMQEYNEEQFTNFRQEMNGKITSLENKMDEGFSSLHSFVGCWMWQQPTSQ